MSEEVKIIYQTGAQVVTIDYDGDYVRFSDCESCEGKGYHQLNRVGYSWQVRRISDKQQCKDCALKHGNPEFYNARSVLKDIESEVKKSLTVKVNAKGKLTAEQVKAIEEIQDSPLARQYRQILKTHWGGWVEPERIAQS